MSGAHVLHDLLALVLFTGLVVAGFLLAAALRRTPGLAHLARPVRRVAVGTLVLLVWFGSGAYGGNGGLVQRALVLTAYGPPLLVAHVTTRRPPA